ncbi:expressed unknown protein [Seminavis robusta]|uniref:Uncharacterized protein n=1 Tax=Seminavis robusta TaxID=568900 RepID=A0A9N8DMW1_9STRA|nr:expressed unknown protein [Seminavis robusta]|eukprot:Sro223_g091270.1 n/a (327) ;mRNA; r:1822-3020
MAPTTTRDAVAAPKIEIALTIILGKDYFLQVGESGEGDDSELKEFMLGTRQKAFDWIVNQDPMQLTYDAPKLVQLFLLVLFYYQTTRHKPWRECNPTATGQFITVHVDCVLDSHTSETYSSAWNGLNGHLPWEIAHLSHVTRLVLENNVQTGALPQSLFSNQAVPVLEMLGLRTSKLSSLRISSNRLTGTIPSELGLLPLKELYLGNTALTGSLLPMEIFQRASRVVYYEPGDSSVVSCCVRICSNVFQRRVNTHVYVSCFAVVSCCQKLGAIQPGESGLDRALEYLDLSHTGISGSLPSEIGLAYPLAELRVSDTTLETKNSAKQ